MLWALAHPLHPVTDHLVLQTQAYYLDILTWYSEDKLSGLVALALVEVFDIIENSCNVWVNNKQIFSNESDLIMSTSLLLYLSWSAISNLAL
jgi:hypothetical protein